MDILFATLPIVLLIYWMAKPSPLPSHQALPLVALIMYFVRLVYFADAPNQVNATVVLGLLSALVPISIIAGAIFLFKTMEASGSMSLIRSWLNCVTGNRVAQLMIIGWAFSFMIEGASGIGTPAALAGPILVGLGFPALKVAVFCLLMNSVPVSFGAVGTPTWYGFAPVLETLSPDAQAILLQEVGIKTAVIHGVAALFVPLFGIICAMGWKAARANIVYIYLSVASCVVPYVILGFFSYEFPALIAGMIGFGLSIWIASKGLGLEQSEDTLEPKQAAPAGRLVKALFPLWGTVLVLLITRIPQIRVKALLTSSEGGLSVPLGTLGQLGISPSLVLSLKEIFGTAESWVFQILYVPWLIPFFLVSGITFLLYRSAPALIKETLQDTGKMVALPSIALLGALVYVRLVMTGGETSSATIIGTSLANAVGENWTFLAPYLGAIGSFFSGSATISNLTFGSIQYTVAETLELPASTILALQSVGGAMGNMICINNIVAICAILGISQYEGRILRMNALPMFCYGLIAIITVICIF